MSEISEDDVQSLVELLDGFPVKEIQKKIEERLNRCGIMYRIFSRVKSSSSTCEKLKRKKTEYEKGHRKMQDIIGYRIVLYFRDDIDICIRILENLFEVDNCEYDHPDTETFKPQRINYVFKIPVELGDFAKGLMDANLVDNTFEVQIRTIFSEGWHEVEHDVRYKFLQDWNGENEIARELNGVFAVLEICDTNILSICDSMAYKKYKDKDWEAMIRHKFRLRLKHESMKPELVDALNEDLATAKALYRFERWKMIDYLSRNPIPLTCSNIVYAANELELNNDKIKEMVPDRIRETCQKYLKESESGF